MFEGLTKLGSIHQAKCQANEVPIKFTKVKIGNGILLDSEDPRDLTDIKSLKKEVDIVEKTQVEDAVRMLIQIDNTGLTQGYYPREIGIYAMDGEVEILYWYINDGNECSYLTPATKAPINFKIWVNLLATSLESIIVNWTGKELWVDREYLGKELEKKQDVTDNRLLTTAKKIWEAINELFNNKLEKGTYTGNAGNLNEEISKKASKTTLGRIIVGDNLTVDSNGRMSGNPAVDISGKLDKGNVPDKYNTAEKIGIELEKKQNKDDNELITNAKTIVGAINENCEKFKNFCPFPINSIFLSLDNSNPATLFLGTTWEKQEGRFLLGSGSAYALGSTGGSSTTTLSKENLPNVKLQIDSFSLGKGTQEITGDFYTSNYIGYAGSGAFYRKQSGLGGHGGDSSSGNKIGFQASKSWTGMSTSAAPYTTNMGDSTPFSNMPPYLAVNIWKRLS